MNKNELIEYLADKEHASWANWMSYLFDTCGINTDGQHLTPAGSCLIPADLVERWKRQVATPYKALSEREKQSDRDEVAHILPFIDAYRDDAISEIKRHRIEEITD